MNIEQLNFVCKKLGFTGNRKKSCEAIIICGTSAYSSEGIYNIPKGTANRDAIKCAVKWGELLEDAQVINDLLVKANETNLQSTKS